MQIQLYKDFNKRVNSTKIPAGVHFESVGVELKRPTNIINPVFVLTSNYVNANYVYVPDWGRYYFVNDKVFGNNNLIELHCALDVLATYRSDILSYDAYVERTSHPNYFNPDIRDGAVSVEDRVEHTSQTSTGCCIAPDLLYIVRIMGRGSTNGIGTFVMNRFRLQDLFSSLWGDIDTGTATGNVLEFLQLYIANPSEYIVGVYSTPIGMSYYAPYTTNETVYVGGHETTAKLDRVNAGTVTLDSNIRLNKPTIHYTDFRKTDGAFSQYTIYIPTIGCVPLSPEIMDCDLRMDISADLQSGDLFFTLKADGVIVSTYNSNCYSSVSIGTLNTSQSAFTGATQVMASAMTANPIGLIEGIKTGFNPTPSVIGTQGGTGCITEHSDIVITVMQKSSGDLSTSVYGRPCCKYLGLNGLLGHYVKCGNASIDIAGTETDKNEVNARLNGGVYLE